MRKEIAEHPGFKSLQRLLAGGSPPPATVDLLLSLGVRDPDRALRNLQSLALHPAFPREDTVFLNQFLGALGETFEPERALANLERILETRADPDALLGAIRRSARFRTVLFTLAGGSQFLTDTVLRHPDYLDWLSRPAVLKGTLKKESLEKELWRWVRETEGDSAESANALRRYRQREYLRIGLRDLMRLADMEETTLALSDLADACLSAALRVARAELEPRFGKPRWKTKEGRWRPCEFAVIALGKHGGQELNFSSDIDLLFVYSSDEGGTTGVPGAGGGRRSRKISNHEFHARLVRRIISLMSENTEEGHVFRVDARLRPEGEQGAPTYSLRSCEIYYESWGETWERQVLIKARHAAGDPALGEAFKAMVRPFIYRRTLDLSALDEIGRIKDRIDRKLTARKKNHLDVKLGPGGIREIEFIVQAYQLIYGGKEPLLRSPNTLRSLSAIQALGLLPMDDARALADAYIFLRDVEHRIQMTHGLQTHDLPTDPHGLTVLARKMGYRGEEGKGERRQFETALSAHQEAVARIFGNFFRGRSAPRAPAEAKGPEADALPEAAETLEDSLSPQDLAPYNFGDLEGVSAQLRLLRNGEPLARVSARAKRLFDDLLPRLLHWSIDLPDPDRAVTNLRRFVDRGGGREAVFSFLAQNERIFEALLRLFGTSDYLTEIILHQPGLLDLLFQPEILIPAYDPGRMEAELTASARKPSAPGQRFGALAAAKMGEELIIGMRSILGETDILATLSELTALAEATLRAGLGLAEEEVRRLHGCPFEEEGKTPAEFAIIGMGKLGSREMTFGSDLDLVFAYSGPGRTDGRAGGRPARQGPVSNHEYFLKLATRLRDGLAGSAGGARAYEIDLRLRPEGSKGTLVAPLSTFEKYFRDRAESWERQALCRARPVAGGAGLGAAFMERVRDFVYGREVSPDFAREVDHIRERLERELAREAGGQIDIKLGHGGIADIEFIVQYLQIAHGPEHPSLRRPETYPLLEELRKTGALTAADEEALRDAYRFLRLVENRLRIANAQPLQTFPKTPEGMEMLARRIGYRDDEEGSSRAKLLADYERKTQTVRRIYDSIVRKAPARRGGDS